MMIFIAADVSLMAYAAVRLTTSTMPQASKWMLAALFVFMQFVMIHAFIRIASGAIRVRKKGKKTIEYLESNGLMEAAVEEYNHPNKVVFHMADRDHSFDNFAYRDNTLTEHFIFALSSNRIIRYQDVDRTCLVLYQFANVESYSNEVFTLRTHEGEEIDLLSYQRRGVTKGKPPRELIDWMCAVIKSRNPKCEVSGVLQTIRQR